MKLYRQGGFYASDGPSSSITARGDPTPTPFGDSAPACAEGSYRIYEVDPLTCRCGAEMRMVAFIAEPSAIRKILAHLDLKLARQRAPPEPPSPTSTERHHPMTRSLCAPNPRNSPARPPLDRRCVWPSRRQPNPGRDSGHVLGENPARGSLRPGIELPDMY